MQKGGGAGKGKGSSSFSASATPQHATPKSVPKHPSHATPASSSSHGGSMFFGGVVESEARTARSSRIIFSDGAPDIELSFWTGSSSHVSNLPVPKSPPASRSQFLQLTDQVSMFPWWQADAPAGESAVEGISEQFDCFHSRVRLPIGEALLIDTGAPKNMIGDKCADRIAAAATPHGFGMSVEPLARVMHIEGVGRNANTCDDCIVAPIALEGGQVAHYKAIRVKDSEIPAILGTESLEARRSIIDTVHGFLIELGPGEYELKLPPGSIVRKMHKAPTGHYMLPCTSWDTAKPAVGPVKTYTTM